MARALNNPLAVSLGDPAGIGPEVIAKCWDHRDSFNLPPFVAIGDPRSVAAVWDGPIEVIDDPRVVVTPHVGDHHHRAAR